MQEQMDLFTYMDHNPIENACCVIKEGVCQDISWEELFDWKKYDSLRCVTYVSSGSFFEKAIGSFKNIEIVIGIEKGDVKRAFDESMRARIHNEGEKFFTSLSDHGKENVIDRRLKVYYSMANTIIHSKFYLLSNSESGENRLIFGSANLTESAFSNGIQQFEDVLVFDNDELFVQYEKRFDAILVKTTDFIPEDTIKNYKEGRLISVADFTAEEKTERLLETMKKENIIPLISEGLLQQVQENQDIEEKEMAEVRTTYEMIALSTKKSRKTGGYEIKSPKELETIKPKIVDILFKGTKQDFELARFALNYNEADKKQYQIFTNAEGEEGSRAAEVYDRQATSGEIKKSIADIL